MTESAPRRSKWRTVGLVFLWMFRGGCVFMAGSVVVGWSSLWRLPGVASREQVELYDLMVRAIEWESDRKLRPFFLINRSDAIGQGMVVVDPPDTGKVTGMTISQRGPYHYQLDFKSDKGDFSLTTTTPHLTVKPAELEEARRGVEAFYTDLDAAQRTQLLEWGSSLLLTHWHDLHSDSTYPSEYLIPPIEGTEEEQLWAVWKTLLADNPSAAKDLLRLETLVRAAYANPLDYDAAIAWAKTFYGRLEAERADFRKVSRLFNPIEKDEPRPARSYIKNTLPPATEATWWWLLYQYVGLDEPSRTFARQRWLDYFAPRKADRLLAWGKELEAERRAAGEPLPPAADNIPLLCAVERLTGVDAYGARCQEALQKHYSIAMRRYLGGSLVVAPPNDDFLYVLASGDPFRFHPLHHLAMIFMKIMALALLLYGFRLALFLILSEWVLRLRGLAAYEEFRRGRDRGHFSLAGLLFSYVAVPLVLWIISLITVPVQVDVLILSPFHLLLGVYLAVVLGGTLISVLARLAAIIMLRCGLDINKIWYDEMVGVVLGVLVLWHFQNDWLSILAFTSFEVGPVLITLARGRLRGQSASGVAPGPQAAVFTPDDDCIDLIPVDETEPPRRMPPPIPTAAQIPLAAPAPRPTPPPPRQSPVPPPLPNAARQKYQSEGVSFTYPKYWRLDKVPLTADKRSCRYRLAFAEGWLCFDVHQGRHGTILKHYQQQLIQDPTYQNVRCMPVQGALAGRRAHGFRITCTGLGSAQVGQVLAVKIQNQTVVSFWMTLEPAAAAIDKELRGVIDTLVVQPA